jgi:hypothetical protein
MNVYLLEQYDNHGIHLIAICANRNAVERSQVLWCSNIREIYPTAIIDQDLLSDSIIARNEYFRYATLTVKERVVLE